MTGSAQRSKPSRPPVSWSWLNAAHGAVLAIPAVVACVFDPAIGLPLAVGVLPAAALGLRRPRRQRFLVVIVGALAGVSMIIGSLVAPFPMIAVLTVFALCVVVAVLMVNPRRRFAPLALMLGVPLIGVGLSETPSAALAAGVLMLVGSVYAWLVSLIWRDAPAPPRPAKQAADRRAMLVYGIQIGLAGAAGAALGFALGVDHPGWASAAAMLISRPDRDLLDTRSIGRVVSVLLGAIIACAIAALNPPDPVLAGVALLVLAGASATAGSRWYVMPFFSTTLVLSMLIGNETETAAHWFLERVLLTLAGAALALLAAWIVPNIARFIRPHDHRPT
ncbi:FUSC family protein [Microbacterium sp. NPDC056044]|uniref:FUSC family protein n=1 Tax=Microbacterium sp. NPDC056044 TaxID=3345690 RepID=UPI0035DA24FF